MPVSERPYRTTVVTPVSVFIGPSLVALGLLALVSDGGLGPLLIGVGTVVTVIGLVGRARRVREALDFETRMMLHAADDPDE